MQQRSSEEIAHEREVLEDMLGSEGWRVFVRRCAHEWKGDGFHARIGTSIQSGDPVAARVTYAVSLEIERAIQWPTDRVKHLRGHAE